MSFDKAINYCTPHTSSNSENCALDMPMSSNTFKCTCNKNSNGRIYIFFYFLESQVILYSLFIDIVMIFIRETQKGISWLAIYRHLHVGSKGKKMDVFFFFFKSQISTRNIAQALTCVVMCRSIRAFTCRNRIQG